MLESLSSGLMCCSGLICCSGLHDVICSGSSGSVQALLKSCDLLMCMHINTSSTAYFQFETVDLAHEGMWSAA